MITLNLRSSIGAHIQYPHSWNTPSIEDLARLKPGDNVKVVAQYEQHEFPTGSSYFAAERFWVEIVEIREEGILGKVNNDLIGPVNHYGEEIMVRFDQVSSIYTAELDG